MNQSMTSQDNGQQQSDHEFVCYRSSVEGKLTKVFSAKQELKWVQLSYIRGVKTYSHNGIAGFQLNLT